MVVRAPELVVAFGASIAITEALSPQALAAFGVKPGAPIAAFVTNPKSCRAGRRGILMERKAMFHTTRAIQIRACSKNRSPSFPSP